VDHLVSSAQVIELVEGVNGGGVNEEDANASINGVGVIEEDANVVVNGGVINEEEANVAVNGGVVNEKEANIVVNGGMVNEEEANAIVNGGWVNEEEANVDADFGGTNEIEGAGDVFQEVQNTKEMANCDDESGVLSGDDEPDELDQSKDERHIDDDDCFGMENTPCGNFSQVLDRWKKFKQWKNRKKLIKEGMGTVEANKSEGLGTSSTQ